MQAGPGPSDNHGSLLWLDGFDKHCVAIAASLNPPEH
jgi:hypothetical protein